MIVVVVQLGFHTCRGSASCGGLRFAFSFSFVTQASCGHRERGRTVRGLNGVGRGQGGRSHAQRAPAARSQSSVGTKVAFRESAACRTAVSLVVMRSRPAGSAPLFVPGGKAFCRSKLARPRETPAEVGPVSQEAGLAAVAQHEQHDSSSRSTRSAAARAFSTTMAAQKWGDKEAGRGC